jgi:NitT/TauT family transport system permease protein
MRSTGWNTFRYVRVPSALPHFFVGLKVGATLAVVGAIVGEFIAAQSGLGYQLLRAYAFVQTERMFSILFLMALLGMDFFYAVLALESVFTPWHVSRRRDPRRPGPMRRVTNTLSDEQATYGSTPTPVHNSDVSA